MESAFACLKMKTNSKKVPSTGIVMHTNRQTEVFAYITDRVIIMHHLKGEIMIIYF